MKDVQRDGSLEAVSVDLRTRSIGTPLVMRAKDGTPYCFSRDKRDGVYNLCRSQFATSLTSSNLIVNGVMTALTVGVAPLLTGFMTTPRFDLDEFRKICREADVLSAAKSLAANDLRVAYEQANSIQDLGSFLKRYQGVGYDSEGLIDKAKAKLESLQAEKKHAEYLNDFEQINTSYAAASFQSYWGTYDPDGLMPQVKIKEQQLREAEAERERVREASEKEQQRQQEAGAAREKAQTRQTIVTFRKSLGIGQETHCGMIVGTNKSLIKVQTMIGEHWFRTEQLYPPRFAPCSFTNNVYDDIGPFFLGGAGSQDIQNLPRVNTPKTAKSTPSTATEAPRPRCINPANGMPMLDPSGGCGGVDVTGKPYGMR